MKARTSEGDAVGRGGLSCGMRDCFSGDVDELLMIEMPRRMYRLFGKVMETVCLYNTSGCGLIIETSMWLMVYAQDGITAESARYPGLCLGEGLIVDIMPFHVLPDIERPTYISAS